MEDKLGEGSYGYVIKAKHRKTGSMRAIKYIGDVFYNSYEAQKVSREITIMR